MSRNSVLWSKWAEELRQSMMTSLEPVVTKSVAEIIEETGAEQSPAVLQSRRFWNACREGQGSHGILLKAGLQVNFEPSKEGKVETVTFTLNEVWQSIMQRVLDRQQA